LEIVARDLKDSQAKTCRTIAVRDRYNAALQARRRRLRPPDIVRPGRAITIAFIQSLELTVGKGWEVHSARSDDFGREKW